MIVDLEFGTAEEAGGLLATMQKVWASGSAPIGATPDARIVETVETVEL